MVSSEISLISELFMAHFRNVTGINIDTSSMVDIGGHLCRGVLESYLRDQVVTVSKYLDLNIIFFEGGYAIKGHTGLNKYGFYLMAEHSKRMRRFKTVDTALNVCRRIGVDSVSVYF